MSKVNLDALDKAFAKCPEGPAFASSDEAKDTIPHKNSGLALVDTGRVSDWPIARLCEWNTAGFIARVYTDYAALSTELRAARKVVEAARRANGWQDEHLQTALAEYDKATK